MTYAGPEGDKEAPPGPGDDIVDGGAPVGGSAARVMVVEDDVLIALDLSMMIEETGARVVGPFHTLEAARAGLEPATPDLAILDYNIGLDTSEALAARLDGLGVPVAFLTGHSAEHITGRIGGATVIEKPVSKANLAQLLSAL